MTKSDLKPEKVTLICAAQGQVLRTSYILFRVDTTPEGNTCRNCCQNTETI